MSERDAMAIARAQGGDREAFRALVDRHSRGIFRVAHRMTGNQQDAEDVVQETFLRAYRQLARFESRANFGTWIHRIAVNCSIDLIRSRPHREVPQDAGDLDRAGPPPAGSPGSPTPERLMLSRQIQERLADALAWLSPMERAAFVLRHFEGLTIEDISHTLGLRPTAARHSVFRAVRKMRRALEPFVEG
jgi:RNA polymerase sigma-70 factor (ECF subfamily)